MASSPLQHQNFEASLHTQLGNFMHVMAANFGFQLPQPEPRITMNAPPRPGGTLCEDGGNTHANLFSACRRNASRSSQSPSSTGVASPESTQPPMTNHAPGTPHTPQPLHRGGSSLTIASANGESASHHPTVAMPSLVITPPVHGVIADAHAEACHDMRRAALPDVPIPLPEFGAEFVGRSSAPPVHPPPACGSGVSALASVMTMEDAMLDALTKRDAHKAAERKVAKAAAAAAVLSTAAANTSSTLLPTAKAKVMGGAVANAAAVARESRDHYASAAPPPKRYRSKTTVPSIAPMSGPTPPPSTSSLGCSKCRWNNAGCAHCLRVALRLSEGRV
jgi:hypothetical protein